MLELVRPNKRRPADQLDGYSADLTDAVKNVNVEYKISKDEVSNEKALAWAKDKFGF